jgi:uncharacterized membrane protein
MFFLCIRTNSKSFSYIFYKKKNKMYFYHVLKNTKMDIIVGLTFIYRIGHSLIFEIY